MANDLVVQIGARLDQFQRDMDQAGSIAESAVSKIESSFASLNPGVNLSAITAIATGGVAAFGALITALGTVNHELAEISKNAEFAGVSVEQFQRLQFAATQGGVSSSEAVSSIRDAARLLADAKENENSLTKLLDANNIKYKDRNGQVIKLTELLTVAGDLIRKFDSMPEKVQAAKMLGLTENWVQALHDGGKAFNDLAAQADAAGVVIDKATIAKAEAFDTAWAKSSASLALQFKAVAGDIAGFLDGLIEKAGILIEETLKSQNVQPGAGQQQFNALADALDVARKDALGLAQDVNQLSRVIDNMTAKGGDPEIIAGLEAARQKAIEAQKEIAKVNLGAALTEFPGGQVPLPTGRPAAADRPTGAARLPVRGGGGTGAEPFERQIAQIEKHTAKLQADAATVGESEGAQEEYRIQLQLTNAALEQYGEVTADVENKIADLSARAAQAKQTFAEQTAILHKLNSASQQFGSAISNSFADAIIEGKKLNEVMSDLLKTIAKAIINQTIGGLFAPAPGQNASPLAALFGFGGAKQGGGPIMAGHPYLVGEHGPEMIVPSQSGMVVPNDALRGGTGSGGGIVYSPAIDARGASVEAVARLAQIMEQDRAAFASRTVAVIQQARRGRVRGL